MSFHFIVRWWLFTSCFFYYRLYLWEVVSPSIFDILDSSMKANESFYLTPWWWNKSLKWYWWLEPKVLMVYFLLSLNLFGSVRLGVLSPETFRGVVGWIVVIIGVMESSMVSFSSGMLSSVMFFNFFYNLDFHRLNGKTRIPCFRVPHCFYLFSTVAVVKIFGRWRSHGNCINKGFSTPLLGKLGCI